MILTSCGEFVGRGPWDEFLIHFLGCCLYYQVVHLTPCLVPGHGGEKCVCLYDSFLRMPRLHCSLNSLNERRRLISYMSQLFYSIRRDDICNGSGNGGQA